MALLGAVPLMVSCGGRSTRAPLIASFYPLRFVAEQVAGPSAAVRNLTPAGAEPHDLELSAQDLVGLRRAELVVYLARFSPAVDDAVKVAAQGHAFDVSGAARLLGSGTSADPHFWLDPLRLADVGDAVAERLATMHPTSAAAYRVAAARLRERLIALDAEFRAGLRDCTSRELVTGHAAFGYLAERYGLHQTGVTGLQPDREPTPAELADVADYVKAHGVHTIYTETLVSAATARTVAEATGATTAVLDPIEGVKSGSNDDYFSIMRADLAVLRTGQGCR